MFRFVILSAACLTAVTAAGPIAAQVWRSPDGADARLWREVAHTHVHKSGHDLLGDRLHKEGHHEVDRLKGRHVTVDVKNGKVERMDAEDLKMKRVKHNRKLAEGGLVFAANGPFQLAQTEVAYYGYCFDDGVQYSCYWYPSDDVNVADYTWEPYDPTY